MSASARFLVCVPTYDERENLERMIEALAAVREQPDATGDVLVIDDSSPDGTGALADELAASGRGCTCCTGRARRASGGRISTASAGRSRATTTTCSRWTATSRTTRPPCPRCSRRRAAAPISCSARATARAGASRTGAARGALISSAGCLYARTLLGVRVRDLTGGYKCFRRAVLEAIELDAVDAQGYQFQIEMTYRALLLGFTVQEVPITFADRIAGGSKMSRSIVFEAMRRVPLLRLEAAARPNCPETLTCAAPGEC